MSPSRPTISRGVLVLAVTMLAAGALAITPASAGKFLTKKKAMSLFYSKAAADARFVNADEKASDADKLDGQDSSAFLGSAAKAADANMIDGIDSSALAKKLDNVITVSSSGGDFSSVVAAMDSITDNGFSNPYLVVVGPGTYAGSVTVKDYVTLQGAGDRATTLTATGASSCNDAFTLRGGLVTVVTDIKIENTGGASCAVGIRNDTAVAYYRDVLVSVHGADTNIGVRNDNSSVRLLNVALGAGSADGTTDGVGTEQLNGSVVYLIQFDAVVSGGDDAYVVHNGDSNLFIRDSALHANPTSGDSYGIFTQFGTGDTIDVEGSRISGVDASIFNSLGTNIYVGATQLLGGAAVNTGTLVCAQVFDDAYTAFDGPACP